MIHTAICPGVDFRTINDVPVLIDSAPLEFARGSPLNKIRHKRIPCLSVLGLLRKRSPLNFDKRLSCPRRKMVAVPLFLG